MRSRSSTISALLWGAALLWSVPGSACIWDADSVDDEKRSSPTLAAVILNEAPEKPDADVLERRITRLKAMPQRDDPSWWNDLAGAYLRLGRPAEAAALLEPVIRRFPKDYGMHANLGTAYHLLGRYREAEKEIARDLEINPEGHFGLERYHLALLQYLARDKGYQRRHVYVDEWTVPFFESIPEVIQDPDQPVYVPDGPSGKPITPREQVEELGRQRSAAREPHERKRLARELLRAKAGLDEPPGYRARWNLGSDPRLEDGVLYMASLNREQPAAWVMLGVVSHRRRDLNLTAAAYERAIRLGSPQADVLQEKIDDIRRHIRRAESHRPRPARVVSWLVVFFGVPIGALAGFLWWLRGRRGGGRG